MRTSHKHAAGDSSDERATGGTFNGVRIFSATMIANRAVLGEQVSDWIAAHPQYAICDVVVTQSSDDAFHCIAISVFYLE